MNASVEKYKTARMLAFKGDQRTETDDIIFNSAKIVNGRPFYVINDSVNYVDKNKKVKSMYSGAECYIYMPSKRRNAFVLKENSPAEFIKHRDARSSYYYMEFDSRYKITNKKLIFREENTSTLWNIFEYMYPYVIVIRKTDTNGDGIADYKDKKACIMSSVNVITGEMKNLLPAPFDFNGLKVHSSGLVFFGDEVERDNHVQLFVFNPDTGDLQVFLDLEGGSYLHWQISDDWKHLSYKEIIDTDGDGNFYDWNDQSRLWYVQLY